MGPPPETQVLPLSLVLLSAPGCSEEHGRLRRGRDHHEGQVASGDRSSRLHVGLQIGQRLGAAAGERSKDKS